MTSIGIRQVFIIELIHFFITYDAHIGEYTYESVYIDTYIYIEDIQIKLTKRLWIIWSNHLFPEVAH